MKWKVSEIWLSASVISAKKIVFHFGRDQIFKRFYQLFFRTTGLQKVININWIPYHISLEISQKKVKWLWSLSKIWAKLGPMLWKKNKEAGISRVFFIISMRYIGLYIQKQEVVVVEITELKLKAKLAINSIFEGNYDKIVASKMTKSYYFKGFYFKLVSL